jgi:hypothetical protein
LWKKVFLRNSDADTQLGYADFGGWLFQRAKRFSKSHFSLDHIWDPTRAPDGWWTKSCTRPSQGQCSSQESNLESSWEGPSEDSHGKTQL